MKEIFRQLYKIFPFKLFFFRIIRSIFSVKEKIWIHFYFTGDFTFKYFEHELKMRNYNSKLETSLFWSGDFQEERESLRIWNELSKVSDNIFDVGANTGLFSIIAKASNPNNNIYAFEPINRIYKRLKHNTLINKMNIHSYLIAISNEDGSADIYDLDVDHHYHASLKKSEVNHFKGIRPTKVDTCRFDSFLNLENIKSVDLVKIDVEGFEVEVIEGMDLTIKQYMPSILIEIKSEENADLIYEMTKDIGYEFYDINEERGLQKHEKLVKSSRWNCLLLSPKHQEIFKEIQFGG